MNFSTTRRLMTAFCSVAVTLGAWASAPTLEVLPGVPFEGEKIAKAPARAAAEAQKETLDFTLALDPYNATALDGDFVGSYVYQAFCLDEYNATLYAGAEITAINLFTGVNNKSGYNDVKEITVFIMDGTGQTVYYSQVATLGDTRFTFTSIPLDTPYKIEAGKSLVVGYKLKVPSKDSLYIVIDGFIRGESEGCYIGIDDNKGSVQWSMLSEYVGNLNIGMTVAGDNLPKNGASLLVSSLQPVCFPGKPFESQIILLNEAVNQIESVEVTSKVGDAEAFTQEIKLDEPLKYGEYDIVTVKNLISEKEGLSIPVNLEITKVNGENNISRDISGTMQGTCFAEENGFKRTFLVEEGTGTWCGWCPAGIVMMEKLKEKYPEEVVRVALHYNDLMEVESCTPVLQLYSGFPSAYLNRTESLAPTAANVLEEIDEYISYYGSFPSVAEVSDIKVVKNERNEVQVEADVRFALSTPTNKAFGISYYITEDQMGPYRQQNYYAGGENGQMGDWANHKSSVNIKFDDVARYFAGGIKGSNTFLPANVEVGETYTSKMTMPISAVNGESFYVTALLVDRNSGSVINCKQIPVTRESGVEYTEADGFRVISGAGQLSVAGEFAAAQIYDLGGRMIAALNSETTVTLPAGMYIVVVDGKAFKTLVK